MKLTIPEILEKASKATNHVDKMNAIRQNGSLALETVLQYGFAEHLTFTLPEGTPPFKRNINIPVDMSQTNLYQEARRLYIFLTGFAPNMKQGLKEQRFIEMLEGIHWTEADLLIAMKDKTIPDLYPGITYEFVFEAIPDLLPHPSTRRNVFVDDKPYTEAVKIIAQADQEQEVVEDTLPLEQSIQKPSGPLRAKISDNPNYISLKGYVRGTTREDILAGRAIKSSK